MGSALDLADHGRCAAADYREVYPEYLTSAHKIEGMLTAWLDAESINYLATSARAKSIDSFRAKASRAAKEDDTKPRYREPLSEITDLVGARVITYLPEAVDRASDIIRRELLVIEDEDKGARARQQGVFGYASRHFLVKLDPVRAAKLEYKVLAGKTVEIQVRTVAQHAWAEFEHDVRYKVLIPPDRKPEFDRRFLLAAALMELADSEFTEIDRLYRALAKESVEVARGFRSARESQAPRLGRRSSRPEGATPPWDPSSLTNWLAERYGDAPKSKREHYAWMFDLLASCGVSNFDQLESIVTQIDSDAVNAAMQHQFAAGQVRRLDDDLLAAMGRDYIQRSTQNADRGDVLRARLEKLRSRGIVA